MSMVVDLASSMSQSGVAVTAVVLGAGLFFLLKSNNSSNHAVDNAPPVPTTTNKNNCVLILGAGTIGSSFSAVFLARGMEVVCVDPMVKKEILEKRIREYWPSLVARGLTSIKEPPFQSLTFWESVQEAMQASGKNITFVQEATWEDVDNKQKVLGDLDGLIDPSIIIASSTSFITWNLISSQCKHKHRIMIGHPAIPHSHSYMEIYGCNPQWASYCKEWYAAAGFDTIVMKKTIPGHVFNSFLLVNMEHGSKLVRNGVCSVEDVNTAMRHFGRDMYARHVFVTLLCGIGGDRGVEGGKVLAQRIRKDAIFLVLFSGMKERGFPDFLAKPIGKHLGQLILSLMPKTPPEQMRACENFEKELTEGGKVPVSEAMFKKGSKVYDIIPMEVGNDPFGRPKPK